MYYFIGDIFMNEENLIKYYNKFNEDKRLTRRHGIIEYRTATKYIHEYLNTMDNPKIIEFLKLIDVLVDGPFILEKKSLDCVFRGSTNQRIIDTKLSLKNKEVVLVDKYYTEKKVKNKRDRIYI